MRMLNMKRCVIILLALFSLMGIAVGSSVYFLNVNDYAGWISQQIKRSTGYDVRFEGFENNWLTDSSISLSGLSLYQHQQRVLYINRLELKVDKLDLWQRQLEIASIRINGVELEANTSLLLASNHKASSQVSSSTSTQITALQSVSWERLHITKLEVTGLNASLQSEINSLTLKETDISVNDLLLIDNSQLQQIPKSVDLATKISFLKVSDSKNNLTLSNLQLSVNAFLFARQGRLNVEVDEVLVESEKQPILKLESLALQLALQKNKLLLKPFSVNAFSGKLALQAEADLAINFLPQPAIKVSKVTLVSLLAENMQLTVPEFLLSNSASHSLPNSASNLQPNSSSNSASLPIETLLIKNAQLKNISVSSEAEKLPLTLKSMDVQVHDLYVIKGHQWLDPIQYTQQAGVFSLGFEYLQWQALQVEKFTTAGSLNEGDQSVRFLKQILVD
ncbi:hypothetical protein [Psychromonas sp. Urea-02u-13]|uniref:hypothetical protein n=1 Tax=Psychromonas sp. Urea-02u-13 TaxID=2058326 RepID=UPI000C34DFCF|nr:hypothetical protein [Psychromonas sp. Urea-02u-13]PKG40866.1 hypothetical protein CXF74_00675 [Psychromonas sp. Urea-02u-13]